MDFELTDEQQQVVSAFREFGERVFTPEAVLQWRDDQGLPDDVVQEFVQLYFGLLDHHGHRALEGSLLMQALIIEELSRCSGSTLPFQNDLFYLHIMAGFASDADLSTVVDNYRDTGRVMFALAVSEPQGGSDTMNMKTRVERVGGRLFLNGEKTFVNNGEYAPYLLIAAIDGEVPPTDRYAQLALWLVPRRQKGIYAYPISKIGQPMLPFASMRFENVELEPEWRLTGSKGGFPLLFALLERGRIFTCASSLGMAQAAMEDAVRYSSGRKAFGTKVTDFQLIQEKMTDMELRLQNMRSILYKAASDIDRDAPDHRLTVALMKRYIPQAATQVASDAMQILGGMGYTTSQRISAIWEDCRGNQLAEGTDEIMVRIAAPLIQRKYLGNE
ncbi:MAG: acyl-CoA dehydrogenase family protein [Eggerthellaceae bacterium]|jgi:alkylation response protein AidB-like acyl-CoA dehydrogenase